MANRFCEWLWIAHEDGGTWEAECGDYSVQFTNGGTLETSEYQFCPFCGRNLIYALADTVYVSAVAVAR
jgi:hypothetical protein